MRGKAKFKSTEFFNKYIKYYNENILVNGANLLLNRINEVLSTLDIYNTNNSLFNTIHREFISNYMDTRFHFSNGLEKDLSFVNNYLSNMGGQYEIFDELEDICFLSYGKYLFAIFNSDEFLLKEYVENLDDLTLSEYKKIALLGDTDNPMSVMIPGEEKSLNGINVEKAHIKSAIDDMQTKINNINNGVYPELDLIQAQIKALQDEMEEKKRNLLAEIQKKKAVLDAKMNELKIFLKQVGKSIVVIEEGLTHM